MQLTREKLWHLAVIYEYLSPKEQINLYQGVCRYFNPSEIFYVIDIREWCSKNFYDWLLDVDYYEELAPYYEEKITIITIDDERYPERLRQIYQPPLALFCRGNLALLKTLSIGMVGSRWHSDYGEFCLKKLMYELKGSKVTIISGLAKGIDGISHKYALKYGLQTIAVIGTGLNVYYPKENACLQRSIEQKGLVISEYPLNSRPLKFHFPYRNRIIAGLSHGVCVVEARMRSGSLITANLALQENRQVFAIPGNITNIYSEGTNQLIQAGALCTTKAQDILEDIIYFS
ncbi:DNA processing protein [Granulicatella balaenopterae]|uniref:DNA processing protein n=1 Tax=Granulicatella balaenopterae TaxID=137733 RepID=A0A1H9LSI8_9LACT|nr:DNA-processing protein DprA [Granulicatella balaenopterae]SER14431.1 DNA processing protein [Granulicatella balaenopterae]